MSIIRRIKAMLPNSRKKAIDNRKYYSMRLRIYDSYLHVSCGGDWSEFWPLLESSTAQFSKLIKDIGSNETDEFIIQNDGDSRAYITNLKKWASQAGWFFIGQLVGKGWTIDEIRYEFVDQILLCDLHIKE